ncbi:MAG: glycosyltransferase family 2 protein [Marinilabiliaceae bacterium]|nr:glycosyltransferase family 2 protein [Marinilabiliaceae bacterium]
MNKPLLTVIVPCYNVENYIDKSVVSIVNQTYTNLEILLINDGSTDNTGTICEAWRERDKRIKVIHKQNEGLAYARKTGIENISSEFVTFLDSDDWIDIEMYSELMSALMSTDSDIAQCGVCEVSEDDGRIVSYCNESKKGKLEIFDTTESVLLILEDARWRSYMGNKIFKTHLFNNIEFPKGRGFGEDFISHDLFHKVRQSVYLHKDYYFYFKRNGSITKTENLSAEIKNQQDYSDAYYERYMFTNSYPQYHSALPRIKKMTICIGMNLLRNMINYPQFFKFDYFYTKARQLSLIPINQNDRLSKSIKINFLLLKFSPKFYKIIKKIYLKILKITNNLKITNRPTTRTLKEYFRWK